MDATDFSRAESQVILEIIDKTTNGEMSHDMADLLKTVMPAYIKYCTMNVKDEEESADRMVKIPSTFVTIITSLIAGNIKKEGSVIVLNMMGEVFNDSMNRAKNSLIESGNFE